MISAQGLARNSQRRTVVVFTIFIFVVFLAPMFAPYDFDGSDATNARFQKPSLAHVMGTDIADRDLFSRVLVGTRKSVLIATSAMAIALTCGTLIGVSAALSGRVVGTILMRATDVAMGVPRFLVLLAVTSIPFARFNTWQLALVIGLTGWFDIARLTNAETTDLLSRDWFAASRAMGVGTSRLARKHIFPHLLPMLVVLATVGIGRVVVLEASLSYLGAGTSGLSLGTLLHDGFGALGGKWWMIIFPGLALVSIVLACNALGDALRDVFAPEQVHAWPTT